MDESAALGLVGGLVDAAGDDAALVDGSAFTIDMLHETTDFPPGTTRYTAGWRAVGASLSDVAAMGAEASAAVAVYAAPEFDGAALESFVAGAQEVCAAVGAEYVGGDLDSHDEFTVATAALGDADHRIGRGGASPGEQVVVTGALGRSAAALELFDAGETERANALFQFMPRVAAGRALAPHATAMMDSSDGLARSLYQLADASDCGFAVEADRVPVADDLAALVAEPLTPAVSFGEDFELVATVPSDAVPEVREAAPVDVSVLGEVTESGVTMDGEELGNNGWTH